MSILRRAAAPVNYAAAPATYGAPVSYAAPATYAAPRATYGAPMTYAAPATYGAPVTYAAPTTYAAPRATYAAPTTYAAPMAYAQPMPIQSKRQKTPKSQIPKFEATNQLVPDAAEGGCDKVKDVHALVVYVDYGFQPAKSAGWCPAGFGEKLDTFENAMMFKQLLEQSGVRDITVIANTQATKQAVTQAIRACGARCDMDDVFLFFYSGHGNGMKDQDGDEEDGQDEAMCLPDAGGNCNEGTWLRDDDFAAEVCNVRSGQKLIVLDCCHSGTMLDFQKHMWQGQRAISIVGCKDAQESAGMGGGTRGGAFTKAVDAAVRGVGNRTVSVGAVFNELMKHSQRFIPAGHKQDITIMCAPGMEGPQKMEWPLKVSGGAPAQQPMGFPVQQPMMVQQQPMMVQQPMGFPVQQPMMVQQQPRMVQQQPMMVQQQPMMVQQQPMMAQRPFMQAAPQFGGSVMYR